MFGITDGGTIQKSIDYLVKLRAQIPYATSLGLNNLAKEAQADTEDRLLREKFTLRSPWFKHGSKYGFNIKFAKKDELEATMGTAADWMKRQEEGGIKTPTQSSNVAIPERENLGLSPDQKIAKGERPRQIVGMDRIFFAKMPSGIEGIWERTGEDRFPVRLLYLFKKSASVKARFGFVETETALVERRYSPVMQAALNQALATMK